MLNVDQMKADIRGNWAALIKDDRNGNLKPKNAAEKAHQIFENTFDSEKDYIVIGPDCLRDKKRLVEKHGLITFSPKKSGGAILGEKEWSLLINDCFLLGAIRRGKRVVVVNLKPESLIIEKLWNAKTKSFTTMGRELAILKEAGYVLVPNENGIGLEVGKSNPYTSLCDLWDRINKSDPSALLKFITG